MALTREARDTLYLLLVLAWTLAPQAAHVPAWAGAMAALALLWRAALAWRARPLPPRWVTATVLLLACALTWYSHRSMIGREAGLTLLVVLAALKTLELRARRDATVMFFLGFFLVLANFLHTQSLAIALAMGVSVWGLLGALLLSNLPLGRPPLAQVLGMAARLLLLGTPLLLALFMLFPRIGPLWGQPGDVGGRSGLSEHLRLGDVADLALDDRVAMRLRFDGPVPAPAQRYFRGPVLSDLDASGQWLARPAVLQRLSGAGGTRFDDQQLPAQALGETTRYDMVVEPLRVRSLPLLELSLRAPRVDGAELRLAAQPDGVWMSDTPLSDRILVRAQASLRSRLPSASAYPAARQALGDDLALPAPVHPRTRAWARQFVAGLPGGDAPALVAALLAHIRQNPYRYTLSPGSPPPGADALDHFWLDERAGFCEHYAAAMVVVLRAAGVPARIVTGYQGGQINPVDGVLEVRQSDAHAWIEYWRDDLGWQRADPTAAVAPERIERTARLAAPPGLISQALWSGPAPAWTARIGALWGAVDHRWNDWVLGYSPKRQRDLLRSLGWDEVDLPGLVRLLGLLMAGAAVLGLLPALWLYRRGRPISPRDPWLRTWARAGLALRQRGLDCPPHWPPRRAAAALRERHGNAGQALAEALTAFEDQRYAAPQGPAAGNGLDHASAQPPSPRAQGRALLTLIRQWPAAR
jgi:transglutaminase-like putative cysteine protease